MARNEIYGAKKHKKWGEKVLLFPADYHKRKKYLIVENIEYVSEPGNTKGGSITVLLTSCLTGLELPV